ncbi:MAG: hypothetical protein KIS67_24565 [Verrucomicrobiae bacterium]|nr:hypothetical protein [Verrucomicrobiae bacterium]
MRWKTREKNDLGAADTDKVLEAKFAGAGPAVKLNFALVPRRQAHRRPSSCRVRFVSLVLAVSVTLAAGAAASHSASSADEKRLHPSGQPFAVTSTNFMQFLRTPPLIDTLVYRRVLLNRPRAFRTKAELNDFLEKSKGKIFDNKSEELFALKYLSPRHLVFQKLDAVTNAWSKTTRVGTFFGRYNEIWWSLTPTGAMTTDSQNGIYRRNGSEITAFADKYRMATEFLRLGMYDLVMSSIEGTDALGSPSDGIHFTGRSEYGGLIDGVAKCRDGFVLEIAYRISNTSSKITGRIINVIHENGRLHSFQVSNLVGAKSEPSLYSYYEVIQLDMPTGELPETSCAVEQFLTETDRRVLTKENGEQHFFSPRGLVPVSVAQAPNVVPKTLMVRIVCLLAIVLPLAILLVRYKRRAS